MAMIQNRAALPKKKRGYSARSVDRLITACELFLSPYAPERDEPFSVDITQDDVALAAMRGALDELIEQRKATR